VNDIKPINSEADYESVLAQVAELMDATPNSPDGDRLDVLVTLIEAYEEKNWRIDPPDPIDAIKLRMEQRGLTRKDLERVLGSRSRVSEILNRKRALTLEMVRRLHHAFGIPAESLIKPTVRRKAPARRRRRAA